MKNFNLLAKLRDLSVFSSGILAHHYTGKLLDQKENQDEAITQANRDRISQETLEKVNKISNQIDELGDNSSITPEQQTLMGNKIDESVKLAQLVEESLNNTEVEDDGNVKENFTSFRKSIDEVKDYWDSINKTDNKILPDFSDMTDYLDKLTLLQESALLHILIFLVLLLTIINILVVLFANEIIKYFKIESRYPSIARLLILRSKLQKYYLIWNVFILILFCIGGISINMLVWVKM
jgi:hypothetical protein